MSDAKRFTAAEMVFAQRAAFVEGVYCIPSTGAKAEAVERYPLPKVKRTRFVDDPEVSLVRWFVSEGEICGEAGDCGHWYSFSHGHSAFIPTAARVALWADLLAKPTVEVEE